MQRFFFMLLLSSLTLLACTEETTKEAKEAPTVEQKYQPEPFDWQAHRGGKGLMPENTIPAFLNALKFPEVRTLELDLVVSKDRFLVVSHEPWMSAKICLTPDKERISEAKEKSYNIFELRYIDLVEYDCGTLENPDFPAQKHRRAHKPRLADIVSVVERGEKSINYNIEIKSSPSGDNKFHPAPPSFAKLVVDNLNQLGIKERATIQSFDVRALEEVHRLDSSIAIALLVGQGESKGLDQDLANLSFKPQIYSPNHNLVSSELVSKAHAQNIKVIPWTVNDTTRMMNLVEMNVDGLITDYPDRIGRVASKMNYGF